MQSLEQLIVQLAQAHLDDFRRIKANPKTMAELYELSEEETVRFNAIKSYTKIQAFTDITRLADHGLSPETSQQLLEIEEQASALLGTLEE
ncbi:hypothetical protein H0A36_26860 [Endozoicomonas sp. SM1973]|uniref:Uncharacterized protein n=1 Tax=Spartinivicinus marinus TaxID=2994442 RepID=A0A853I6V1_9GAMM|nr:hypothetical protein [Spartinivicinus marinus]MCX4030301.1 hypothetical protein [Spartinivicinus marinus]NYZ69640.1 hypothetical protein [Spartinivicinus marinus]